MMICPIPQVAEALGPFLKPRAEVAAIRQDLQAYLETQLQRNGQTLSVATLGLPSLSQELGEPPPPALSGVRRAYWRALQAHQAAQAKYEALKAELQELRENHGVNDCTTGDRGSEAITEGYIPLLRQREKHRKLQVVEEALENINAASSTANSGSVDNLVRSQAGDAPIPPTSSLVPSSRNTQSEDKTLQLKKAIVSAQRTIDEQSASHPANNSSETHPSAELHALRKAHDGLTVWMEQQLAAIADAEAENQAVPESPTVNGSKQDRPVTGVEIEELYEEYLVARQRLIQTTTNPPISEEQLPDAPDLSAGLRNKDSEHSTSSVTTLLPYIPHLISLKQKEQSLLQESSYMKRHLSSAETETERMTARLADESHLVHPGASKGKHWTFAALDAEAGTKEFVEQRVKAGMDSAGKAERVLRKIHEVPKSLDLLSEAKP